MSIKNILIMTVVMSLGGHDTAQAEIIRDTVIPNLNVTAALGQWYGLISSNDNGNISCSTMTLGPLSERSFTMNSTFYETGKEPYSLVFNCPLVKDSNVIECDKGAAGKMIALIIDIEYSTYMVMYTTSTIENMASGNNGYLFLMGRGKEFPNEIFMKVKKSKFYLEGLKPGIELHVKRTDGCP